MSQDQEEPPNTEHRPLASGANVCVGFAVLAFASPLLEVKTSIIWVYIVCITSLLAGLNAHKQLLQHPAQFLGAVRTKMGMTISGIFLAWASLDLVLTSLLGTKCLCHGV